MSKKKITKNGFDSDTHLWRTRAIVGEAYGLKEEVEEVRHISKLQESAEELPYAVRNLNLPDLKEDYLEEKRHLIELNEHKNFARQDLEDEEIDRLAREEVERSLYEDGIIEDPDCDGGLNG